jgi:hypothetical protein
MVLTMVHNIQNQWDFGLCPSSGILETKKHNISETGSVSFLMLVLSKGPKREGDFFRSLEDRNRTSFRNVVFYSYLELRTIVKVHKLSDFECYTPTSEPFRIY